MNEKRLTREEREADLWETFRVVPVTFDSASVGEVIQDILDFEFAEG